MTTIDKAPTAAPLTRHDPHSVGIFNVKHWLRVLRFLINACVSRSPPPSRVWWTSPTAQLHFSFPSSTTCGTSCRWPAVFFTHLLLLTSPLPVAQRGNPFHAYRIAGTALTSIVVEWSCLRPIFAFCFARWMNSISHNHLLPYLVPQHPIASGSGKPSIGNLLRNLHPIASGGYWYI